MSHSHNPPTAHFVGDHTNPLWKALLGPRTLFWDARPGSGWWSHRHPTGHTIADILPAGM